MYHDEFMDMYSDTEVMSNDLIFGGDPFSI